MVVTPACGVEVPAKLPMVVLLAPRAKAAKPKADAPPDVPVAAPCATDEMPHATSCWLAEAEPPPLSGAEPVALTPQTTWADAGLVGAKTQSEPTRAKVPAALLRRVKPNALIENFLSLIFLSLITLPDSGLAGGI